MASEVKKVPIPRRGVDYRGKIVLAPMVRSGELPSRLLALRYGADLVWGKQICEVLGQVWALTFCCRSGNSRLLDNRSNATGQS